MKSIIATFSFFLLLLTSLNAYSQSKLSLGAEIAFPNKEVFNIIRVAGTGAGASLRFEGGKKKLKTMFTAGYLSFAEATYSFSSFGYTCKFKAIPMQVGLKYYVLDNKSKSSPFISVETGLMRTSTERKFNNNLPDDKYTLTDLCAAPGVGFQLGGLELGFRLQYNLSDAGYDPYYYNFRAGYNLLALTKRAKSDL